MSAELIEAIKAQQASIERLANSVALLVGAVGELLGEELGKADDGEDNPLRTLDGERVTFRGSRSG